MKDRTNNHRPPSGPLVALSSALLFGASTPIAKLLLGITDPQLIAGLLYLGSGVGLALVTAAGRLFGLERPKRRCVPAICRGLPRLCCSAACSVRYC